MEYLCVLLPKLAGFLILIGLGAGIARAGIVTRESLPAFSAFLVKVVLPCLIVTLLVQRGTTFASLGEYGVFVGCQAAMYLLMGAAGLLTAHLTGLEPKAAAVYRGDCVGGNHAFVFIPLAMSLFSPEGGQQYIPISSAVDTFFVWTLGLTLYTMSSGYRAGGILPALKKLANPIMAALLATLCINSLGLSIPEIVLSPIQSVSAISDSLGLIYVGCGMYYLQRGGRGLLRPAAMFLAVKLLAVPMAVFVLASRFLPREGAMALMLISGSPAMTTSCTISSQYDLDEGFAAAMVLVSTLGCMVTIPILFLLTGWL